MGISRDRRPSLTIIVGAFVFAATLQEAIAEPAPVELHVKPQRCISLHRGQTCYQKLTFRWSTPSTGEYCLHNERSGRVMACWRGSEKISYEYELQAAQTTRFTIKESGQGEVLANVSVQVASVYRSPERSSSRWRLF